MLVVFSHETFVEAAAHLGGKHLCRWLVVADEQASHACCDFVVRLEEQANT